MVPLRNFVWYRSEILTLGTTTRVNSSWCDSRWHDILWWYHVNEYRATRGNRGEFAVARKSPRCHINKFDYITFYSPSIFSLAKSLHLILKIIATYVQISESGLIYRLIAQRIISKPVMTNCVPCDGVFVVIFFKTIYNGKKKKQQQQQQQQLSGSVVVIYGVIKESKIGIS